MLEALAEPTGSVNVPVNVGLASGAHVVQSGRLVRDAPLIAGKFPSNLVASMDVAAEIVPGAMNVAGIERVGVVVEPSLVIWLAVPMTDVTVPEPPPVPETLFHAPALQS